MQALESTTVLTTAERVDYFRHACGDGSHYCVDPRRTLPLADFLGNLALSGGGTVVLDEDHFVHEDDLKAGLRTFLDEPLPLFKPLRIVAVCSHRRAPDEFLHFLTSYCAVYDVVYDVEDVELAAVLARVLARPHCRTDVLELLRPVEPDGETAAEGTGEGPAEADDERITVDIRISIAPAPNGAVSVQKVSAR